MSTWPELRIHVARLLDPRRDFSPAAAELADVPQGQIDVDVLVVATDDLSITGAQVRPQEPVVVKGTVTAGHDGLAFRGFVVSRLFAECRRCLDDVEQQISVAVNVILVPEELVEDTDATEIDVYPIDGDWIDLGAVVRTELMLALPSAAVCDGECGGPAAGIATGPEADDDDETPRIDPRWAKLSEVTFETE